MGLIDFVKNAGARIFGGGHDAKDTSAAATPEEVTKQAETTMAAALVQQVKNHNLEIEELRIEFATGVATVDGKTASQAEREKVVLAIGNVNGVAQVNDQIEVVTPEPEAVYYTVQRGDTLSRIAREQYGTAMKYPVIFEANRPMLKDPDRIYPGQVLRIPPLQS